MGAVKLFAPQGGQAGFSYTLKRSKRKTVGIYILPDGSVEVRAPERARQADIERILAQKHGWVLKHSESQRERNRKRASFEIDYGATARLFGEEYPILRGEGPRAYFDGESFVLPGGLGPDELKSAMVELYRGLAKRHIPARVELFSAAMAVQNLSGVKITGAKTQWGSCSAKNSLCFSWRLVLVPQALIDYVVVHELAHTVEHNHSPRFWAIVEGVFSDYKELKKQLGLQAAALALEDWRDI